MLQFGYSTFTIGQLSTPEINSIDKNEILERIRKVMTFTTIIVAREKHGGDQGHHFYVGILVEEGAQRRS